MAEPDIADEIDIGFLLQRFSDDPIGDFDLDLDLLRHSWVSASDPPPNVFQISGSSSSVHPTNFFSSPPQPESPDSTSSLVNYVEKFLMDDVDWDEGDNGIGDEGMIDQFLSGVFLDGSDAPETAYDASEEEQKREMEIPDVAAAEGNEDVSNKKLRRKMRNRESAMISREKKKIYIKDLEIKSEHMGTECRRLDHILQCCLAENMALRHRLELQKNNPCGVPVAKQESAVLFMESLLLGSLFWFVSVVCLFLVPSLRCLTGPISKALSESGRDLTMALRLSKSLKFFLLSRLRRGCRSMRSRMKLHLSFSPCCSCLI